MIYFAKKKKIGNKKINEFYCLFEWNGMKLHGVMVDGWVAVRAHLHTIMQMSRVLHTWHSSALAPLFFSYIVAVIKCAHRTLEYFRNWNAFNLFHSIKLIDLARYRSVATPQSIRAAPCPHYTGQFKWLNYNGFDWWMLLINENKMFFFFNFIRKVIFCPNIVKKVNIFS